MRIKRNLHIMVILFLSVTFLGAQELAPCGTQLSPEQERYLDATKEARQSYNIRTATTWIPVQIHVVTQSAGTGGESIYTINQLMGALNLEFYHSNIQFYYCSDPNYIASDQLYNFDYVDDTTLTNHHDALNVMNVYFVGSLTSNGSSLCGYAYFPGGPDHILISKQCTFDNSTFIHEFGHAFSLYHTHGKTNTGTTDELVNGFNCTVAGDDVCDTPADPNLWQNTNGCSYTAGQTDINGDTYVPDVSNIMSYAPSNCRTNLSNGQASRMAYSANNDRPYLTCSTPPACSVVIPILNNPYNESFESGWGGWQNYTDAWAAELGHNQFDFVINSGGTPTANTGPTSAPNGSNYVFAEATGNNPNYLALLRSPCFDLSSTFNPKMSVKSHQFGSQAGKFVVQVSHDGGFNWSLPLFYTVGDQGNQWNTDTIDLAEYKNARAIQIRIAVQTLQGEIGDIAFDEVHVWEDNVVSCPVANSPCDDNDPTTYNDIEDGNCNCAGTPCPTAGTSCDDNDPNTINDMEDGSCNCAGTPVPTCTNVVINSNNFDNGWGIWNDGGSDCRRSTKDAAYAYSGNRCVRLRDNTSSSTTTTDNMDLTSFDTITVDFTYIARSMDNSGEDFWLQISTNGGSSFTTVEEWNLNDEFTNGVREFDAVDIPGPFSATTKLRFRCDASGNSDWIYLDDIVISGCDYGTNLNNQVLADVISEETKNEVAAFIETEEIFVYPNPAKHKLNVHLQLAEGNYTMNLYALNGSMMKSQPINSDSYQQKVVLDLENISNGIYLLTVDGEGVSMNQRVVVTK